MRAEGFSDPGEKEPEVIINLRHGPHGRTGVPGHALLIDSDGRRKTFDRFHMRPLHLFQELSRIGRKGFDIPALPLGIQRVEGQGRLPRAADPGDDDQPVSRDLHVDILQIVDLCSPNQYLFHGSPVEKLTDNHGSVKFQGEINLQFRQQGYDGALRLSGKTLTNRFYQIKCLI
jgi:hypothetical protein